MWSNLKKTKNYINDISRNHRPPYNVLPKEFLAEVINFIRLDFDPQINEYKNFIENDMFEFCQNLINVHRDYDKYNIAIIVSNVRVSPPHGNYEIIKKKYFYDFQNPDGYQQYVVSCDINVKVTKSGSLLFIEPIGTVGFGIPKMYSANEDTGLSAKEELMLGLTGETTNYFTKFGYKHKINYKETMPTNSMNCTHPAPNLFTADIISSKHGTNVSSHIDITYDTIDKHTTMSLFLARIDQDLNMSIRTIFMILGVFTFESALSYVVQPNDPNFHTIADLFYTMYAEPQSREVEPTRLAETVEDLYAVIKKHQIKVENTEKFNNINMPTFFAIIYSNIMPRIRQDPNDENATVTEMYIGKYINTLINTILGNNEPGNRHTYTDKTVKSPATQVKKAIAITVREHITHPLTNKLESLLGPNLNEDPATNLPLLRKIVVAISASSVNKTTENILARIRNGLLYTEVKGSSYGRSSTHRDINSRMTEPKSQAHIISSDTLMYISGDSNSSSINQHRLKKRSPDRAGELSVNYTYTPDSNDNVGLIRDISISTTVTIARVDIAQLVTYLQSHPLFRPLQYRSDMTNPLYYCIFIDAVVYGYTTEPALMRKQMIKDRHHHKFDDLVSIRLIYDRREINLSTTLGRLRSLLFSINDDGNLNATEQDIQDVIDKKQSIPDLIAAAKLVWLYTHEADNILYTHNINKVKELASYGYYMPKTMNQSVADLLFMPAYQNCNNNRRTMVANQKNPLVGYQLGFFGTTVKNQNQLVCFDEPNFKCTLEPHTTQAVMNLLCAMYSGRGDTEEDSCEISDDIPLSALGTFLRCSIEKHTTELSESYINPNMSKDYDSSLEYSNLNERGWVRVGTLLNPNDVISCMVSSRNNKLTIVRWLKKSVGLVKEVNLFVSLKGKGGAQSRTLTITTVYEITIETGNKYYITNACKTVARVIPACMMPMTEDGRNVSICYSNRSIIKRYNMIPPILILTQAQQRHDPDADIAKPADVGITTDSDILSYFRDLYDKYGVEGAQRYLGYQHLIDKTTGVRTERKLPVFSIGVAVNNHTAKAKEHVRNDDITQSHEDPNTGQPRKGAANNGGLRVGKLSLSCIANHGDMGYLNTVTSINSDGIDYPICITCGSTESTVYTDKVAYCQQCSLAADVRLGRSSYLANKFKRVNLTRGILMEMVHKKPNLASVIEV